MTSNGSDDVLVKRRWGYSITARGGRRDPTQEECHKSGYFFRKHLVKILKTSDPSVTLEFCRRCKLVGPRL